MTGANMLRRTFFIFLDLALVPMCTFLPVTSAGAQDRDQTELAKAEQAYNEGYFDQVILLVDSCLSKDSLTTAEQARAYKLAGQAYASKNDLQAAESYVRKLLEASPEYEPDRDQDLQAWIELVDEVRRTREQGMQQQQLPEPADDQSVAPADASKNGGSKKWLWLGGGGTLVTAGIVYVLISQEKPKESRQPIGFPDPPGRP
jgi:tetratricopeptide (TPR) repeat protein